MTLHEEHWTHLASGKTACRFPVRNDGLIPEEKLGKVQLGLVSDNESLQLCHLYAAWALVLNIYTGSEGTAFVGVDGQQKRGTGELSMVSLEVDHAPELSIGGLVEKLSLQISQNSLAAGSVENETWTRVQGLTFPVNTLVLWDVHLTNEQREDLHHSVRKPCEVSPENVRF